MSKKFFILLALALAALCAAVIAVRGDRYVLGVDAGEWISHPQEIAVEIEQQGAVVELESRSVKDGKLLLAFRAVGKGRAFVTVHAGQRVLLGERLCVHASGCITCGEYFGDCSGSRIIPVCMSVYLALLALAVAQKYRRGIHGNLYQTRNIRALGLLLILLSMLAGQILQLVHFSGLLHTAESVLETGKQFAEFTLPPAFILSLLITASSVRLLRREGRTWRNMLGCILGVLFCLGTLSPILLGEFLQRTTWIDVHNERGFWLYAELAVENIVFAVVAYLECMLIGTIAVSVRAARGVPDMDRDYMLILGCQIRKDGTLPRLLQQRADRALEFAQMQKNAGGKDVIFVPSGGQGSDEIMPEAHAIRNYLLAAGVAPERILTEDRSTSTLENFRFSMQRIQETTDLAEPKIAFATTNYHVFRAGMLAAQLGVNAQGIGSRTKSYYWINAFIREFIATLYAERRSHARMLVVLAALVILMVLFLYVGRVL